MAKKRLFKINIHEVRNHSGARHQSSEDAVPHLFQTHSILHCSFILCVLGPSLFISIDYIVFVSRYESVNVHWRSVHSVGDLNRSLFSLHSLPPPVQGTHTARQIAPAASFSLCVCVCVHVYTQEDSMNIQQNFTKNEIPSNL